MTGSIFGPTRLLVEPIRASKHSLRNAADLDPLMDLIDESRFVLIGEASHGTSDYYVWRARLTQRLIAEKGFNFVAVEVDWPDCYKVNRFVKGYPDSGGSGFEVLHAFDRWPTWMWANWEMVAFTEWLRKHNHTLPEHRRVGFYGLDVYSLWDSMNAVVRYLEDSNGETAALARQAFACFDPFFKDEQQYGWSTALGLGDCEKQVLQVLSELQQHRARFEEDPEAAFDAEMNATVAVNAERYYRTMVRASAESWNVRDTHMVDTLDKLVEHHGPGTKCVVWEHNTHIGDARATDMAVEGMVNVGQLVRERHDTSGVVLVGFGCYEGSVIAADRWGAPMQRMVVPDARTGSWEQIMHEVQEEAMILLMDDFVGRAAFEQLLGHRAIGVVYRPESERFGNYVPTDLPARYDAFIYLDHTDALHPLHIAQTKAHEPPETYPFAL